MGFIEKKTKNVVSMPTKPDGTQPWQCKICKEIMEYKQPIEFGKQLQLLGDFMAKHTHNNA